MKQWYSKRWNQVCLILGLAALMFLACGQGQSPSEGQAQFVKGSVTVSREGQTTQLKAGDKVFKGDVIETEKNGVAVLVLGKKLVKVEIQPNSQWVINDLGANKSRFTLKKGNAWQWIKRLTKSQDLTFHTPVATAGVRGTKFYTFRMGAYHGICHCDGKVQYKNKKGAYEALHKKDYLVFTKGDKTVIVTPEEFHDLGLNHNHSVLKNSPLGPKDAGMPKAVQEKLMALVEKKLKQYAD